MTFSPNHPWLKDWETYYTTSHRISSSISHLSTQLYTATSQVKKQRAESSHDEALILSLTEKEAVLRNADRKLDLAENYWKKAKEQEPAEIPNTYSPGHGALNGGPSMLALFSVAETLVWEVSRELEALNAQ